MDLAEASNIATLIICFCTVVGLAMAGCAGCIQVRINIRSKEIEVMGNIISLRDQSEMLPAPPPVKKTRFSSEVVVKDEGKEHV
jgi:hypothetical protein